MTIFLTGMRGYIAPHLKIALEHLGYEVMTDDVTLLTKHRFDYVIHLAATTSISTDFNPDIFTNNIIYAQRVLSTPYRTIYASSTSAYELINPYAYTKRYNEYLGELHGNALGFRLFNVYGHGNNKGIIKQAIECCYEGKPLRLPGGGRLRDFIYIDDVVKLIIANLDNKDKLIDIGTGIGTRIIEAVRLVGQIMGKEIRVVDTEAPNSEQEISVANRAANVQWRSVNGAGLKEGLTKTIEMYLNSYAL